MPFQPQSKSLIRYLREQEGFRVTRIQPVATGAQQ